MKAVKTYIEFYTFDIEYILCIFKHICSFLSFIYLFSFDDQWASLELLTVSWVMLEEQGPP